MKTTPLFLLFVTISQTSAGTQAFMTVSPAFSQFFEYQEVSFRCKSSTSGFWTVWRYSTGPESVLSHCGNGWGERLSSGCKINTTKLSDSGVYWCESKHRESSNAVNITITGGAVTLLSPVLPVAEGDDVTLRCRTKNSSSLPAAFFRNDLRIERNQERRMTIYNISKSNEGAYRCEVGANKSSTSWLLLRDHSDPASLTVLPDSSQMYEYGKLELSCGRNSTSRGWRVVRATTVDHKLSPCGESRTDSGCTLNTAKKTDSATYWCESLTRQRSNSVNITVHGGPVILQVPVLPVRKGQNVTLRCQLKGSSKPPAEFYRVDDDDGERVRSAPEGHMTLYHVSASDEGQYKCRVTPKDGTPVESPPSWLFVIDPNAIDPPAAASLVLTVLRHLVVVIPYVISTGFTVSLLRLRKTGRKPPDSIAMSPLGADYEGQDPPYDDVIADVTTEHHF